MVEVLFLIVGELGSLENEDFLFIEVLVKSLGNTSYRVYAL